MRRARHRRMTEIRRALPFLVVVLLLFVAGCSLIPSLVPTNASPEVLPAELAVQREAWRAAGVTDYEWDVSFACECGLGGPTTITVVAGKPVKVVNNGRQVDLATVEGFPLTVDALFADAARTIAGGGTAQATWAGGGVPKTMNLDRDLRAIDDELFVTVNSFTPAR
jgi:Family of unknown function (DUF6174)